MDIIVVSNQKGGIGKTTVARNLIWTGMKKNYRVCAVDFDVQGNLTTTLDNMADASGRYKRVRDPDNNQVIRQPGELLASGLFDPSNKDFPIPSEDNLWAIPADGDILNVERSDLDTVIQVAQERFEQLAPHFDVCVIDTGPAVSNMLILALSVGDFAISPCKPDRDAIAGLMGFFSNVTRVTNTLTGTNPKLASLGVLPNQINKDRAYHREVVQEMRDLWGAGVLPVELYERAAIDMAKDSPVWKTTRGESTSTAAREMKAVCEHIYKRMGL